MFTKFGVITQAFIKSTLAKNNTSMLALIMFYSTRGDHTKKYFKVLSCVVYSIVKNCVFIEYLACLRKTLREINVDSMILSHTTLLILTHLYYFLLVWL